MNNRILFATIKSWNYEEYHRFVKEHPKWECKIIYRTVDLVAEVVDDFNPRFIFVPHWSWIIPKEIWSKYECVVFHATDLPFGRGGSPIQNLIARGMTETKISALKVDGGIDTGPVYMKRDLKLYGSAQDIFRRASKIIFRDMIPEIIVNTPIPVSQEGEVVTFERRTHEQGSMKDLSTVSQVYDYIRMLDAEGYPNPFLETDNFSIEFDTNDDYFYGDGILSAGVIIRKKESKS